MSGCLELEPYVLRVVGESMTPEFPPGAVVVIEPAVTARDGTFVVADTPTGVILRRYRESGDQRWLEELSGSALVAARVSMVDASIRGVVVSRAATPGIRRKHYSR